MRSVAAKFRVFEVYSICLKQTLMLSYGWKIIIAVKTCESFQGYFVHGVIAQLFSGKGPGSENASLGLCELASKFRFAWDICSFCSTILRPGEWSQLEASAVQDKKKGHRAHRNPAYSMHMMQVFHSGKMEKRNLSCLYDMYN